MKRALIFWGGWEGHEPEKVSAKLRDILESNGFSVDLYEGTECLKRREALLEYDLIVPCVTCGKLSEECENNVSYAIEKGVVTGAALDVLEYEKSSFENFFDGGKMPAAFEYLISSPRVVLTPHIGGWTHEANRKMARAIIDKIAALGA